MEIYLHQARYQGDTDSDYSNNQFYKIWIVQKEANILVKKEEHGKVMSAPSKRMYVDINHFFKNWGMISRDCNNIKI